jgi:peptide/nickel transport system substrate-binding protein
MKKPLVILCATLGLLAVMVACSRLPEPALPTLAPTQNQPPPQPTPTPPPAHTDLIVCLAQEPTTLYLYGDTSREADTILEAIYDGPTDLLGFEYQPVILDGLPSFDNGQARFETVGMRSGDIYLNPETGQPETLASGLPYLPPGCTQEECVQTYQGGTVDMDRMVVDFSLDAGHAWSDGEPLTAADSVFSYQLDGDPATPTTKYLFERTYSYQAIDDLSVEWVGLPGFIDADYRSNFWTPLPRHVLQGMTADEVRASDEAAKTPIGWGLYKIDTWASGEQIVLTPNDSYWASSDGGEPFERLIFRFLGGQAGTAVDQLETGECDILDETLLGPGDIPRLDQDQASGDLAFMSLAGSLVMRLDMNLNPVGETAGPALFSDTATREAISLCVDRTAMVESILHGAGEAADSYIPASHPLYAEPSAAQTYDPSRGQQLLDEVGWMTPSSGDGPRIAAGVPGVTDGTPLSFQILAPTGDLYDQIGDLLAADLAECGIDATIKTMPPAELFASWPDGPVFGRSFQTVVWSWPAFGSPACDMFATWEVPSGDHPFGSNASGFSSQAYDQACRQVLWGVPDSPVYREGASETQAIFREQVPAVSLFVRPRVVAYAPWLCGVKLDPSSPSVLWNLESLSTCSVEP